MILLIDNYDSFVFNLARYAEELGRETRVVRNDAITTEEIEALSPQAIILSPGPCDPERAGVCLDVVRRLGARFPILGVCLGHQVIAAAYGAAIARGEPVHGRIGWIDHDERGIFAGLPVPFQAARYHSLVVAPETVPPELEVTARLREAGDLSQRCVMAVRHREHPVVGVQFHPESVLTHHGHLLLANFFEHGNGRGRRPAQPTLVKSEVRSS